MKRFFYLLLLFNLSCQLIDQPEEIPSFIHINDFRSQLTIVIKDLTAKK